MNREFNILLWHNQRQLDYVPKHFVKCETKITDDKMLLWVTDTLEGRYSITTNTNFQDFELTLETRIYFENPTEAMMYELRWSGSN